MKDFLIWVAVYFAIAWLPQLVKYWFFKIGYAWKRRHADHDNKWIYEVMK
jgi:hypothetical protein